MDNNDTERDATKTEWYRENRRQLDLNEAKLRAERLEREQVESWIASMSGIAASVGVLPKFREEIGLLGKFNRWFRESVIPTLTRSRWQ